MHLQYANLDNITTRASKLLGDCKVGNIVKELKKLKEVDTTLLENRIADLKVELASRNDEVENLKKQLRCLERIKEVVGAPGDIFNKACLFDEDIKTEGEVSVAKIVKVLVTFTRKMEIAVVDIWKIVSGVVARKSSRPQMPPPTETPQKEKLLSKVKTPLSQQPENEVIAETSGALPLVEFMMAKPALVVTPISKGKRSVNVEPSPQKGKKESSLEYKELEETSEETERSSGGTRSEQVTPPPETKKKVNTRSSGRKRPPPKFKTLAASKQPPKSSGKRGSSLKKL